MNDEDREEFSLDARKITKRNCLRSLSSRSSTLFVCFVVKGL
jgi:hypothetical protein